MGRFGVAVLGALLCVAPAVALASPSHAAGPCGDPRSGLAGAESSFQTSVFGTRAKIEYNNPNLCGSDAYGSGVSAAWAMVDAWSDDDPNHLHPGWMGYAQAGYLQSGAGASYKRGIWIFAQYSRNCRSHGTCTGISYHTKYGPHPSVAHMYANYLSAGDHHVHMVYDGIKLAETGYNPAGDWAAAWQGEFYGEAHDRNSDILGTQSDKTSMWFVQKYGSSGGINFFQNLTGHTTSGTRYHRHIYNANVGGKGIHVWTYPQ